MSKTPEKLKGDPETTGHSWDGIEEFNNPLPKWWVWVFYVTIIWGVIYTILYPAWPLLNSTTPGLLGWSSRANVAAEIAAVEEANAPINAKLESTELTEIVKDPELKTYAVNAGRAVFGTWCMQCHGSGAQGAKGFPNLLDNDWLWGGTLEDIHTTVSYGIRSPDNDETRFSEMPAFGRDELLEPAQIDAVANYVMSLSGEPKDASKVTEGKVVFEENCAACHGEDGTGDRAQGAPNLADAIWLYGGDYDTIVETVTNARKGVMPAWSGRLDEWQIRAVSVYVHQLGGGE